MDVCFLELSNDQGSGLNLGSGWGLPPPLFHLRLVIKKKKKDVIK